MVLPLDPRVVGGVEVEDEELLREGNGLEQEEEASMRGRGDLVEDDGEGGVEGEGEGDDGVLQVAEVLCRDGAVGGGGVAADEELHGYEDGCD